MSANGKNDTELVRKSLSGSKESFAALYERHRPLALILASRMVRSPQLAEDLVQESFLQAYLELGRLRNHDSFKSWLMAMVLNVCKKHLRDRKIDFLSPEALYGGVLVPAETSRYLTEDPSYVAERRELAEMILEAVELLSPGLRKATLLYYYQDYDVAEIASILGVSNSAVRTRLHRARRFLRGYLQNVFAKYDREVMPEQRRTEMIEVEILDVVYRQEGSAILLIDRKRTKILAIFVGEWEGRSIAMGTKHHELPRPMTHQLMANLLEAAKVKVEHVRVESMKEGIFYSVIKMKCGEEVVEVDARPSDAINLSLRTNCALLVNEDVMQYGVAAPPEAKEGVFRYPGIEEVIAEIEKRYKERVEASGASTEESRQSMIEDLKSRFVKPGEK